MGWVRLCRCRLPLQMSRLGRSGAPGRHRRVGWAGRVSAAVWFLVLCSIAGGRWGSLFRSVGAREGWALSRPSLRRSLGGSARPHGTCHTFGCPHGRRRPPWVPPVCRRLGQAAGGVTTLPVSMRARVSWSPTRAGRFGPPTSLCAQQAVRRHGPGWPSPAVGRPASSPAGRLVRPQCSGGGWRGFSGPVEPDPEHWVRPHWRAIS